MSPETTDGRSTFFRRSLLTYGVQLLGVLCSLVNNLLIARALGPAGKGTTFLIIVLANAIVVFLLLGLDRAVIYFVGRNLYPQRAGLGTATTLAVLFSAIGVCLYILMPHHYQQFIARGLSVHLQVIALVAVPLLLLSMTWTFFAVALNRIRLYNLLRGVSSFSFTFLLVPAYFILPHRVVPFALAWIFSVFLATVVAFILLNRQVPIRLGLDRKFAADAVAFGLKGHVGGILGFFSLRFDVFVLNYFWGASPVGIYSVGVSLAEMLWNLPQAVSTVLRAEVPRLEATGANALTSWANRNTFWLSAVAGILLYVTAHPLLRWFLPAFLASLPVIAILLPGVIAITIVNNVNADVTNRGMPLVPTYTSAASAALAVGLYMWLIPRYGMWGAATASTVTYIFNAVVSLIVYRALTGVEICDMLAFRIDDFRRYGDFYRDLWAMLTRKPTA